MQSCRLRHRNAHNRAGGASSTATGMKAAGCWIGIRSVLHLPMTTTTMLMTMVVTGIGVDKNRVALPLTASSLRQSMGIAVPLT